MRGAIGRLVRVMRRRLRFYRAVAMHPRTPRWSRWCLVAAVGYALTPIDLVPDFVPVLGQLDDVLIVGGLVALGVWLVPGDVIAAVRASMEDG